MTPIPAVRVLSREESEPRPASSVGPSFYAARQPPRGRFLAPFRFFPDDWLGFFTQRGWDAREIRFLGEESLRLGRDIPAPWWAFVFRIFFDRERYRRFQRMTGYVLFARA